MQHAASASYFSGVSFALANQNRRPTRLAQIESISDFGREFFSLWWIADDRWGWKGKEGEESERVERRQSVWWQRTTEGEELERGGWIQRRSMCVPLFRISCGIARKWNNQWHGGTRNTPLFWFARPSRAPKGFPPFALSLWFSPFAVSFHFIMEHRVRPCSLGKSFSHSSLCLRLRRLRWWIIRNSTCLEVVQLTTENDQSRQ